MWVGHMELSSDIAGALLVAGCTFAAFLARKRKFNRTNQFGAERFPTYWDALRSRAADQMLRGASLLLFGVGIIVLASEHFDTWGWVVLAPVCAFLLFLLLGT